MRTVAFTWRVLPAIVAAHVCFVPLLASTPEERGPSSREFSGPEPVRILNYDGDAMEPFVTRDGRYLLFNNRNDPSVDTNLYYAERIDDVTFDFLGEIADVNTTDLEGVPTADRNNDFYFVSPRSYDTTLSTINRVGRQ